MDIQADFDRDMDEERRQMRRERISKMKLLKEKQMRTRRYLKMAAPAAAGFLALVFAFMIVSPKKDTRNKTVPENTYIHPSLSFLCFHKKPSCIYSFPTGPWLTEMEKHSY